MRYSVDWIEKAPNVAPEEQATIADLRLFLADQNVTMHLREKDVFDYLTVSMYPLIEGLVHDWWTIFGTRDQQFSLLRYRAGFAFPDIRFQFDGSTFEISALQLTYANPDVRFWAGASETMTREEAEQALSGLVTTTLEHLKTEGVIGTSAALRWARVVDSRAAPEEAAFCECAGALGRDPYDIDVSLSTLIDEAAATFSDEPLNEFLAGAKSFDAKTLLDWIRKAESRSTGKSTLHGLTDVAHDVALKSPARKGERAWSLGYRRARAIRKHLNISGSDRFKSLKDITRKFGASHNFEPAGKIDGVRALRSDHNGTVSIHLRDHGSSAEAEGAARFSFARAVGDVACFPEPSRSVINELHFASRQSAGRAFAAELLAPIDEIKSMISDGHDVITIADEFGVPTVLIERQMENAQRISESCET